MLPKSLNPCNASFLWMPSMSPSQELALFVLGLDFGDGEGFGGLRVRAARSLLQ